MKHQVDALTFWNQGKHREAATSYWLSFRAIPNPTYETRYHIFHGYTSILRDNYFEASDDDVKNLEQIFRDKHEPRLFRLEAGFTLGVISYARSERLKCQEYYHHAITIGEKSPKNSKQERLEQKKMMITPETQKTMKELQDGVLKICRDNLNGLNRSTREQGMRGVAASHAQDVETAASLSNTFQVCLYHLLHHLQRKLIKWA